MSVEYAQDLKWDVLVSLLIHPTKVAILEALLSIGEPLSATDLMKLFGAYRALSLGNVSHHLASLAKAGVLEVRWRRQVRGAEQKFYFFTSAVQASG